MSDTTIAIELKRLGNFSPLRYPGGKSALTGFLDQIIKAKKLHGSVYVEPFAGGAGAALTLLFLEKVDRIVINDLDPAVYSFWVAVTSNTEWFIEQITTVPLTVEEWRRQKGVYLDTSKSKTKEAGFAFFFLNRTNRSGIVEGCPIGGFNQAGKWKIDARFNRVGLADRIRRIGQYSSSITVRNMDGLELAKEFLSKDEGIVYLDPPYFVKGKSLYLNHFDLAKHKSLADTLNTYPDASWLLTYDNVSEIRDLYPDRKIREFSLSYSAYNARIGSEILIPSDSLSQLLS